MIRFQGAAVIKGGKYLEALGQIKAIALDKTRTLTHGEPALTDIVIFGKKSKEELLSCAAGMEALSEHPLAQSITEYARKQNLSLHPIEEFQSIVGKGAKANCLVCDEKHRCIGKLSFILQEHTVPVEVIETVERLQKQGKTVIIMSSHKEVEGIFALEDSIRPDSATLISQLKEANVIPVMLTGDHQSAAHAVCERIGIKEFQADLLPEDKAAAITQLSLKYKIVAMFGDGVNDAPALALSSVGISMSSLGSDAALEAASIILLNDKLTLIPFLIQLGRKTLSTIKINTLSAITVKFSFIILALFNLTNLALAIFADVGMTVLVILYSLKLTTWKPRKIK